MKYLLAVLMPIMAVVGFVFPAFANDPPTSITFKQMTVFPDLAEDGDAFFLFHVQLAGTGNVTSPTPASIAVLFRLFDTDGTTLISSTHPYVYPLFNNNGFGDIISGFYFPASSNITWEGSYTLNVYGLPAYFSSSVDESYLLVSSDWSTATTQATARTELYTTVLNLCDVFNTIYTDVDLKQTSGSSTPKLSEYGEAYFSGATPGLSIFCPQLYLFQEYVPTTLAVMPYTNDLQDQYSARMATSDFKRGLDRLGANYLGGVSGLFVAGILTFLLVVAICIFTMKQSWGLEPGMLASALIVIMAAILFGDAIFAFTMIAALLAAIALMWVILLRRA